MRAAVLVGAEDVAKKHSYGILAEEQCRPRPAGLA